MSVHSFSCSLNPEHASGAQLRIQRAICQDWQSSTFKYQPKVPDSLCFQVPVDDTDPSSDRPPLELARWEDNNQVCLPTSLRLKWQNNPEWTATVAEFDTKLGGNLILEGEPVEPVSEQPEIDPKYHVCQECDIPGSCVKELSSQLAGIKLKVIEFNENSTYDKASFGIFAVSTEAAVKLSDHTELMPYQGTWVKPPKSSALLTDPHCQTFDVKSSDMVILQIDDVREGGAPKDVRLNCSNFSGM